MLSGCKKGIILKSTFESCKADYEGGAVFVMNSKIALNCSSFILCHTLYTKDNNGGNSITLIDSEINSSMISNNLCWVDKDSGNSVFLSKSRYFQLNSWNVSNCYVCYDGDTIYSRGITSNTEMEYIHIFNSSCNWVIADQSSGNTNINIHYYNAISNEIVLYLAGSDTRRGYIKYGCFFGNTKNDFKNYNVQDSIANFSSSYISYTDQISTYKVYEGNECNLVFTFGPNKKI